MSGHLGFRPLCLSQMDQEDVRVPVIRGGPESPDTFGKARVAVAGISRRLAVLPEGGQDFAKLRYAEGIGNDRMMLAAAGLGVAVMQREGAAVETLLAAKRVDRVDDPRCCPSGAATQPQNNRAVSGGGNA